MAIELGVAYISVLPSTDKLAPHIKAELAKAGVEAGRQGTRSGAAFGSKFKASLSKWTKRGLLAGAGGVAALGTAGLKTASQLEQSRIGFETMLGSAEKANTFLDQIKKTAAQTPFELKGLTQASQKMLAYGFSLKEVIPTLTTIGDAASGLGLGAEGIDRITLALGQMKSKGRVQGNEILQLTEAGIPAMKILQNELHLTAAEYDKMQRAGKITADVAIPALIKGMDKGTKGLAGKTAKFGGLMEKQSQSLAGLFSTLKDTVMIGLANALEPLIPTIKVGLTQAIANVGPALNKASKALASFIQGMKDGSGTGGAFADALRDIWSVTKPVIKTGVALVKLFDKLPGSAKKVLILAAAATILSKKFTNAFPSLENFSVEAAKARTKSLALRGGALALGTGLAALSGPASRASQGLGALTTIGAGVATGYAVGGPWGAAIGGGAGLLQAFTSRSEGAARAQQQFDDAGKAVAETLKEQNGAITKLTRSTAAKSLADLGAFDSARKMGVSFKDALNAALGNEKAIKRVDAATEEYLRANAHGFKSGLKAVAVTSKLTEAVHGSAGAIGEQRQKIAQVNEAMGKAKSKTVTLTVKTPGITGVISNIAQLGSALQRAIDKSKGAKSVGENAKGTNFWRGGLTLVGEEGPELVDLQRGAKVIPNDRLASTARSLHSSAPTLASAAPIASAALPRSLTLKVGDRAFKAYVAEVAGDTANGQEAFDGMTRRLK